MKRLWRATVNSWHGLIAATQSEQAFREELVLLAIGIPLAFFLTADTGKRIRADRLAGFRHDRRIAQHRAREAERPR